VDEGVGDMNEAYADAQPFAGSGLGGRYVFRFP